MNWFVAKIVFQIKNQSLSNQFDIQLRLIKALNPDEAARKALQIGKDDEAIFTNIGNQPVEWKFVGIKNLYPIDKLEDGIELSSQIVVRKNQNEFLNFLNIKHQHIIERGLQLQISQ